MCRRTRTACRVVGRIKALRNGLKIKCDSLNDALEKGKKIGYNKALDDFVNTVKATFPHDNIAICNTEVIAEKLKEGGENDNLRR